MVKVSELLQSLTIPDSYKRVSDTHPLNLYIGLDSSSHYSLLIVCYYKPHKINDSRMIKTRTGKRPDGCWTVSWSLIDNQYRDMFALFCADMMSSSEQIQNKKKGEKFLFHRYEEWKDMLASPVRDILSPQQIKGLLGEMYFLEKYLTKIYGTEKAVRSWVGPHGLPQDFVVDETWYEVKTTSSTADEVLISSIEQLDCLNSGMLIIVLADKTSKTDEGAVNLNLIYRELLKRITDEDIKADLSNILFRYGYYLRPEYEEVDYTFKIKGIKSYKVTSAFPCLRRESLPDSITKAEYKISLSEIKNFKEEGLKWI